MQSRSGDLRNEKSTDRRRRLCGLPSSETHLLHCVPQTRSPTPPRSGCAFPAPRFFIELCVCAPLENRSQFHVVTCFPRVVLRSGNSPPGRASPSPGFAQSTTPGSAPLSLPGGSSLAEPSPAPGVDGAFFFFPFA